MIELSYLQFCVSVVVGSMVGRAIYDCWQSYRSMKRAERSLKNVVILERYLCHPSLDDEERRIRALELLEKGRDDRF